MSFSKLTFLEGIASDHPDIKDQDEFKKKADAILDARRKRRSRSKGPELPSFLNKYKKNSTRVESVEKFYESTYGDDGEIELRSDEINKSVGSKLPSQRKSRKSPGELLRDLNKDLIKKKKKKKNKDNNVNESNNMTDEQKKLEDKLKEKYDSSNMKKNMIKQYGKEKGTQIYFAKIRKMAMEHLEIVQDLDLEYETLEEKKMSRASKRASRIGKPGYDDQGRPKPKGKVRAWDMDETLFRNDPKKIRVHVKDKESGKVTRSLTNQEFNTDKLNKDKEDYDFSEFRSSKKFADASKPNKSMVKKLKKQVRRGKPVHIVTARGSFDDQPKFASHLRRHGIEIDKGKGKGGRHVHVHRAGDMEGSDIGKKKVKIVKGLMQKHGTSGAEMYDDAAKVHRAFKSSAKENPTQPKVKTKMVQPNKKDVTQARSFKESIDLDLIYDFILERLILEGYAESYDEASSLVDEFNDDLIEDLIQESYEMIEDILSEAYDNEEELEVESEEKDLKINYISPYKKLQEKKEIKEKYMVEEIEMTPYEYWKSFIGSGEDEDILINEEIETEVIEDTTPINSYQKWKKLLEVK